MLLPLTLLLRNSYNFGEMKKILLLFSIIFVLNCMKSSIIDAISSDYFPHKTGNTWVLLNSDMDTMIVRVAGDTIIFGDSVKTMEFMGRVEVWNFEEPRIQKLVQLKTFREGEEIVLMDGFAPFIPYPPVEGDSTVETYTNSLVIQGDTFRVFHSMKSKVLGREEVNTPCGNFDSYRIDVQEAYTIESPYESILKAEQYTIYLGPDVGPVKIVVQGEETSTYELIQFLGEL